MTKHLAALCCLALAHSSLVAAEDAIKTTPATTAPVIRVAPQAGPLRTASLSKDTQRMFLAATASAARLSADDSSDDRSWMERHPVWTGAMVGFGAGFLITYAATYDSNNHELFKVMDPAAGAFIWGSVSAGIGALAGWGIGRNHDDGYHDRRSVPASERPSHNRRPR